MIYTYLVFQGMLEDIDRKEQLVHSLYRDMGNLDYQPLLTDNCYTIPNSMHLCFPMKVKKATNKDGDIDNELITANNFFSHLIKEPCVTKYGNNKQLIQTFSSTKSNSTLTRC